MSTPKESEQKAWVIDQRFDSEHWISQGLKGRGELSFRGKLRFSGEWLGQISSDDPEAWLLVRSGATVRGTIRVSNVVIEGTLEDASIESSFVHVTSGAKVFGRIQADKIVCDSGALVQGRVVAAKALPNQKNTSKTKNTEAL